MTVYHKNAAIEPKTITSEQCSDAYSVCNSDVNTVLGLDVVPVESSAPACLGSIAKFTSKTANDRDEATIKRFRLQSAARKLLPTNRVANCLRLMVPGAQDVEVYHVPERDSAHYHNLRTCDSVWDCPVCAAKITERRRVELMLAIARAYEQGYTPVLITWTLRHNRGDKLRDLLQALKSAHGAVKSGGWWQRFKSDYGWVGSVIAAEITHGIARGDKNNGWHPHRHELAFLEPQAAAKLKDLESDLRKRWQHVLKRRGYDATWEHGLTVKDSDAAVIEYVAKWGHEPQGARWTVERELTKAPTKLAAKDGATPFQLLEMYADGNEYAGALFQEYSATFKGSKQLAWANGLRALLGLGNEQTDAQAAASDEDNAELLASISRMNWYRLLQLPRDVRGELLVIARRGDAALFAAHLAGLLGSSEGSADTAGGQSGPDSIGEADTLTNDPGCDWAGPEFCGDGGPAGGLGEGSDVVIGDVDNERHSKPAGQYERSSANHALPGVEYPDTASWLEATGWARVERPGSPGRTVEVGE